MDLVEGMRTFKAVVEAGSFTAAGERLGITKKLASKYVGELEERLGARLLHRTTRSLSLSESGRFYYNRCVQLLEDLDELEGDLRSADSSLSGTLRISAPVAFGEIHVQPILARFWQANKQLTIDLRLDDRYIDLAAEGFDLAIRIGALVDSSLIARRLATTKLVAIASPDYLAANGAPETPYDLDKHVCLRDSNHRDGQAWVFMIDGELERLPVPGGFMVNSAASVRQMALDGGGIALLPDFIVAGDIAQGSLVRLFEKYQAEELDIHVVFLNARRMPRRVRAAIDALSDNIDSSFM